jgi:TM2 domain-containing membrane protein YozV
MKVYYWVVIPLWILSIPAMGWERIPFYITSLVSSILFAAVVAPLVFKANAKV